MINSLESERLESMIRQKIKRYRELKEKEPENPALLYLNSEITFLRDSIMPIVLSNTTVDYSEIRDFVTRTLRKLERHPLARKTTDVVLHIHLKEPDGGKALAAVAHSIDTSKYDIFLNVNLEESNQYYL